MKNTLIPALLSTLVVPGISAQKSAKPNIIYILADDLGYGDVGCYGQKIIETPNIDKLAAGGVQFMQHYAGSTVSAPSRSALLTGLHTGHTPIRGNAEVSPEGQKPLLAGTFTIAHMLKEQGYATGAFGKWGLGFPNSEGNPNAMGFDLFYGYNCQRQAHHYYPEHIYRNNQKIMLPGNENGERKVYAQDLIQEETLNFIRRNAGKPFFAFVPVVLPHAELVSPDDSIAQKYRALIKDEKAYKGAPGSYGSTQTPKADFASMVARLDAYVGQIVEELRKNGIEKNTIIIFSSDNGPHAEGGNNPEFFNSNGLFRGLKRDLYEGGIRVPMIVSWLGKVQAGKVTDHISAQWDVMPTVKELTSSKAKFKTDGVSFAKTILGKKGQKQHKYLYWEFHEMGGRVAVRAGDWKAVVYNYGKNPNATPELYNLKTDPSETKNVAAENPRVLKHLTKMLQNSRTDSKDFNFGR